MKKKIAYIIITAAIALTAFSIGKYSQFQETKTENTNIETIEGHFHKSNT